MTQHDMALEGFRSDAAVVVDEQLPLSAVSERTSNASVVLLRDATGKVVRAVRRDAIQRMASRAPQTPVKAVPSVPCRAVAADQSLDDVRRWIRQGQLQVVVFEVEGAWRAIDALEFEVQ